MQVSIWQDKNLCNASTGLVNARPFENFNSDPICNENRAAAVEKYKVDIITSAHFCMQDAIDICSAKTSEIVF